MATVKKTKWGEIHLCRYHFLPYVNASKKEGRKPEVEYHQWWLEKGDVNSRRQVTEEDKEAARQRRRDAVVHTTT